MIAFTIFAASIPRPEPIRNEFGRPEQSKVETVRLSNPVAVARNEATDPQEQKSDPLTTLPKMYVDYVRRSEQEIAVPMKQLEAKLEAYKSGKIKGHRLKSPIEVKDGKVYFESQSVKVEEIARIEQQLARLSSRLGSHNASLPTNPSVGDMGILPDVVEILQSDGTTARAKTGEYEFILSGYPIQQFADGDSFKMGEIVYVAGNETYTSVLGGTRRLPVLRPADQVMIGYIREVLQRQRE